VKKNQKSRKPREKRKPWDQYFMSIAELVAQRSTCLRRQVGAVIVKDKRILATGYNGAPGGVPHCEDVGCLRGKMGVASGERHELCRGVHAEQNALIQAATFGATPTMLHLHEDAHQCEDREDMLQKRVS